jgi:hypothetical protein
MQFLLKRAVVDTITKSGETFDINNVVSFTVRNIGATDCSIGYQGGGRLGVIEKGTQMEFPGDSGYSWFGTMQINFIGGQSGMVEVFKGVSSTIENM